MRTARNENGDVILVTDDDPRVTGDAIGASLAQSGIYQSPDGWAIVTGSPGGQLGGAPRIITVAGGKQPPADVLAKYPMAAPQENQAFQQQAAKYMAGEGKGMSPGTALAYAVASYFGASALGGLAAGAGGAGAAGAGSVSPAASAVADASWGVNPAASTWGSGIGSGAVGGSVVPAAETAGTGLFGTGITGGQALSGAGALATLSGSGGTDMTGFMGNGSSFAAPTGSIPGLGSLDIPSYSGSILDQFPSPTGTDAFSTGNIAQMDMSTLSPSALQQLASSLGTTPANLLRGGGALAASLLGAVGASQQQSALKALSDQYMAFGAPSRARYEASFQPGFTMANDPGYMDSLNASAKASANALSVNGNPGGSPNAWAQSLKDLQDKTAYPALQNYRNQNAATGGTANFSTGAQDTAVGAIGAGSNIFGAIGKGIANATSPPPTLSDWIAANQNNGSGIFKVAA